MTGLCRLALALALSAFLQHGASIAHAQSTTYYISEINGTMDPFVYTDLEGTFTTGPATLSLDGIGTSFVMHDETTGDFFLHEEMTISFNDGKPGGGSDLVGSLIWEESGIGFVIPFMMTIQSGTISGAGPFNGTTFSGSTTHTSWSVDAHTSSWGSGEVFIDPLLPIVDDDIGVTGEVGAVYSAAPPVPTVSEWGLIVMALLLLTASTFMARLAAGRARHASIRR